MRTSAFITYGLNEKDNYSQCTELLYNLKDILYGFQAFKNRNKLKIERRNIKVCLLKYY